LLSDREDLKFLRTKYQPPTRDCASRSRDDVKKTRTPPAAHQGLPLDDLDRAILNEIQSNFPLAARPYAEMGRRVGASEEEVLRRVAAMAAAGVIRRIGANFTSRKLGYSSTLCAAQVPPDRLSSFIQVVNRYPGVTHNYLRRHRYNVWFTLIAASEDRLREIIGEIAQKSGVQEILSLPARQVFKIKVDFPL